MQSNPLGASSASILCSPAWSPRGNKWSEMLLTSSRGYRLVEEMRVPQMPPWARPPQRQSMPTPPVPCLLKVGSGGILTTTRALQWRIKFQLRVLPSNHFCAMGTKRRDLLPLQKKVNWSHMGTDERMNELMNEWMNGKEFGDFCK